MINDPIVDEEGGSDVSVTFDEAGTYNITCKIHPSMNMTITVEGVETAEQFAFTTAEGCNQVQGYHVSRPLPPDQPPSPGSPPLVPRFCSARPPASVRRWAWRRRSTSLSPIHRSE